MSLTPIKQSPLRHTYPYSAHDVEAPFGTAKQMTTSIREAFNTDPDCRRVVVAIDQDDLDQMRTAEDAGLRFVVNVQLRDGREVSLMVAEPDWVSSQSTDIKDLELE